ncbi:MAG: TIGR03546 family protein, partial [Bdellovibrionia bacterium]
MGLLLKQLFAFIRLLNSDTGTYQLASGLALGIVLGFSPFISIQTFIILTIILFFRVQIGAAFVSAFFFKFVAFLFDGPADSLGRKILENPDFTPLFTQMYNMPLVPLTRFNNSIVMGSGVVGFLLAIPGFFVFTFLIRKYRETILVKIQDSKLMKAIKATPFYNWYLK